MPEYLNDSTKVKTVVLGASTNPSRTSYLATQRLIEKGFETYPVGRKEGTIAGVDILVDQPVIADVHTVTVYLGKDNQPAVYDYILELNPSRIILNPGAENAELQRMAEEHGIETINACTLVMLSLNNYSV